MALTFFCKMYDDYVNVFILYEYDFLDVVAKLIV